MTGEDGTFDLSGLEQRTLTVSLQNPFFRVRNALGVTATVSGTAANASSALTLTFGSGGEYEIAQPSAFYWANRVRVFVGDALRNTDLLNVELQVNTDEDCNSKYSSLFNRVTLYRASLPGSGRSCINKAYRDTVFHEYGHAIDHALGGIASPKEAHAYSEGFGDSLAILFKMTVAMAPIMSGRTPACAMPVRPASCLTRPILRSINAAVSIQALPGNSSRR